MAGGHQGARATRGFGSSFFDDQAVDFLLIERIVVVGHYMCTMEVGHEDAVSRRHYVVVRFTYFTDVDGG